MYSILPSQFLRILAVCLTGLLLRPANAGADDALTLIHPRPETLTDARSDYPLALLRAALAETPGAFKLKTFPQKVTKARALKLLENDQGLDVVWAVTTVEREDRLLPVRIPIHKGLAGMRLLLAHKTVASGLSRVESLDDLRAFTFIQGSDWPDTTVLRHSGLNVLGSTNYASLFQILALGRADLFPRSVLEVWNELAILATDGGPAAARSGEVPSVVLDEHLMLSYPGAIYFFVSKSRPELAQRIGQGLEALIANGGFDRLFESFHGELLKKARLDKRRIIPLVNPLLPPDSPLQRETLWHPAFHTAPQQ